MALRVLETAGPRETEAAGASLAGELGPGDVVLLRGELGAGKTTFVRGACRALGVTGPVTSPTFTIGALYQGRLPVAHLDLYRVGSLQDEEPGLLEPYLRADGIAFVEWAPERSAELHPAPRRVLIAHRGGDRRRLEIG